jgi:hypothetical protein
LYQQLELSERETHVHFGGALKKRTMFLLTTCFIILVVVFLAFDVLNGLYQNTIPVEEIMRDPSSWVNKTVTVEGILESVPMPNPTSYGLCPENQTDFLSVQWNSSDVLIPQYNATTAVVHGTVKEEEWTVPNLIHQNHTVQVYYIEAENVSAAL